MRSTPGRQPEIRASLFARLLGVGRGHSATIGQDAVAFHSPAGTLSLPLKPGIRCQRTRGLLWDRLRVWDPDSHRTAAFPGLLGRDAACLEWFFSLPVLLEPINEANAQFDALCARDAYFNHRALEAWRARSGEIKDVALDRIPAVGEWIPTAWRDERLRFKERRDQGEVIVAERNADYAAGIRSRFGEFFDRLEGNPLTLRQREAIIHDEDNCLVVAGAGTGKTSTVVGKVGFLLDHDGVDPCQVLLLAFARRAKLEMEKRIEERVGASVEVRTFHSLGMEIIRQAERRRPNVSALAADDDPKAKVRTISRYITELLEDPNTSDIVVSFLAFYRYPAEPAEAFGSLGEYYEHIRANAPRSLQGERVKSWEELFIANWLCLQGVRYEYERPYEHDTGSIEHRQYLPDFYLPDFGIYLEHFGVDRNGRTAPYVDRKKYIKGIRWKRDLHKEKGTKLVETYSCDRRLGVLGQSIHDRLDAAGATFSPLSSEKVGELLSGEPVAGVAPLLSTFLSLFKGNAWTVPELRARDEADGGTPRTRAFLSLFEAVYRKYQAELDAAGQIDFDDMIRLAAGHVEAGRFASPFTRIIVDEFQDISRGRCRLLRALLAQQPDARLFCVGDDWQSIYRFTGSDVSIMTGFDRVFGHTRRTDLDQTFRYDDRLLAFSSLFVTQNAAQLKKDLAAHARAERPAVAIVDGGNKGGLEQALREIELEAELAKPAVMILGRYRRSCSAEDLRQLSRAFPGLSLEFRTVHASKGLEADYVVVLDLVSGPGGFPSEISDDPLLSLLLPADGGYPHAEERRLFYVAVTRARKRAYLVTDGACMSPFVQEICTPPFIGLVAGELAAQSHLTCQACEAGLIRRVEGEHGPFWGCSLYPYCTNKPHTCFECGSAPLVLHEAEFFCVSPECAARFDPCPACGGSGVLHKRAGKFGAFLGCSNFRKQGPSCAYTRNLPTAPTPSVPIDCV